MLARIPQSEFLRSERFKFQGGSVKIPRFDLARKIRMAVVAPFLVRPDRRNFTGKNMPNSLRAKRNDLRGVQDAATRRPVTDRKHSQFDQGRRVSPCGAARSVAICLGWFKSGLQRGPRFESPFLSDYSQSVFQLHRLGKM